MGELRIKQPRKAFTGNGFYPHPPKGVYYGVCSQRNHRLPESLRRTGVLPRCDYNSGLATSNATPTATANTTEPHVIDQENSLLPIVTFDASTNWDAVLRLASPHLDQRGLNRLKGAMEGTVKSVAIERHYIDKDYRDTFAGFHAKKFSTPDSRCTRLHFFTTAVNRAMLRNAEAAQPPYLGYAVIRPTRPNCLGRTMLRPAACELVGAHVALCWEEICMQGTVLSVEGFPFISQDADATVCAQSALWMLARYFSNRYPTYPEMNPFRMTSLTKDYSIGRLAPTAGLYLWQIAEALRQIGFAPLIYSRNDHKADFEHLMYTYVESGIPILAAFHNHVVVLFGHRSDFTTGSATPQLQTEFIFSSQYNCEFIGNDDNGMPYQILSNNSTSGAMPQSTSQVEHFVAALPERVFLPAEGFQALVTKFVMRADLGVGVQSPTIAKGKPLFRLFLTTGRSFKKRIGERGMGHERVAEMYRNLPLPHFIWVCEISHPNLYPARVLGEVIWDATRNAHEPDGWIAAHYPEWFAVDAGAALNGPQNLLKFHLGSGTDYPIYENNLRSL